MTIGEEPSVVAALQAKLANLEKQLGDLATKYESLAGSAKDGSKDKSGEAAEKDKDKDKKTKGESELPSPYARVRILKKIKDPLTGEPVERPEESKKDKPEEGGNHAFVLKKILRDKFLGEDDNSEIDILNLDLWELLKASIPAYPYHIFRGPPVTLYSPYEGIIFGWDALHKAASEEPKDEKDKQAREDLSLLLKILSGGASGDSKLDKYFKVRDASMDEKAVHFDDLWTIFPPGKLVYGQPFQSQNQVFVVIDNQSPWPRNSDRDQPWNLSCWAYDWTGEKFQRIYFTLVFAHYDGLRPITALPYYPFELHEDREKIEDELVGRGRKFRELCKAKEGARLFEYKGDTIFGKKGFAGIISGEDDDSDMQSRNQFEYELERLRMSRSRMDMNQRKTAKSSFINSRVMVDHLSYFQFGPSVPRIGALEPMIEAWDCQCYDCRQNTGLTAKYRTHFDTDKAQRAKEWEREQYMLCPPRVLGYILRDKQWAQLQITLVEKLPPKDPEDAWKSRLRLADGERTKDLLFDLVRSHISTSDQETAKAIVEQDDLEVNDIIPGKGKGLVILLYGPPGVGKTSTAETIAVAARKPLFSISVADVGTKARHVEANLSRIFSLATSWQAILLIDEADVFLESRGRGSAASTERNALVSVFLRVLEYYQGIMFLTTNQIAQFDVAIPSRIHVSIQYESLKPLQMEEIFRGFIDPLEANGLVDDYEEILDYLKEDVYSNNFDGRQIRNIVTTALGLARAERKYRKGKGMLSKKHLKAVVGNANKFKVDFGIQYDRYISAQEKLIK